MPKGCGCGEFRSSFHFLRRSKTAFLGLALPKESEWDEAKQKNRATTWSLDASAATILKSGTVKVYFPDKALAWSGVGRVGSCSPLKSSAHRWLTQAKNHFQNGKEDTQDFKGSNLNQWFQGIDGLGLSTQPVGVSAFVAWNHSLGFFFPNKLQFCSYAEHHQSVFLKFLDMFCFFKVQIGIFILARCVCLKVLDAPVMPNLSKFNLSNLEYDSWSIHSHIFPNFSIQITKLAVFTTDFADFHGMTGMIRYDDPHWHGLWDGGPPRFFATPGLWLHRSRWGRRWHLCSLAAVHRWQRGSLQGREIWWLEVGENHNWLVVWNMNFMTFHSVGKNNPKWLKWPIFFQRGSNHQPDKSW